jgi:hypothetical protein
MKVRLNITGTRPLMLHNVRLASPLNVYAKRMKVINNEIKAKNARKVDVDADRLELARVEFEGGLYHDEALGPYMPAQNILASLVGGARLTRDGKKVERGVAIADLQLPLIYRGPRDMEGLWGNGESEYVDVRPVVIGRMKVDRCRPIFHEWALEADILIDPAVIQFDEFVTVSEAAGASEGLGDYRRMFGRYSVDVQPL